MQDSMWVFITTMLTALAVENAVFARGLGLSRGNMFMKSPMAGIIYGGVLTFMVTASSLPVSLITDLLTGNPYILVVRPISYLVCVLAVYAAVHLICRKRESLYAKIKDVLPLSTFNSALFGVFFITAAQNLSPVRTVGYALGTGVGYTAAILIIFYARKRLVISSVPRSFRGLPILLIYIGILSLALFGLIGHSLPT